MPASLGDEINAITADRVAVERRNPSFFWDDQDGGRKLSRQEAQVFGIKYEEFPRMITVWEAWFAFLGLADPDVFGHSLEAIAAGQRAHPELSTGNELPLFVQFATKIGGLTHRQAEAMYWKDWFWTVREGHIHYADEPAHP
jgi:hypothetical protein